MEIVEYNIEDLSIDEFADRHGLTMTVRERSPKYMRTEDCRFYASFDYCDTIGDGVLIGTFGNGATADAAIANYAKDISHERIMVKKPPIRERVEICVPRLYFNERGE